MSVIASVIAWFRQLSSPRFPMAECWKREVCNVTVIDVLLLFSLILPAQTFPAEQSNVELRLRASQIMNGVPDTISFVFVNITDHDVRVPPVSPCIGRYSGTLNLRLEFSPIGPPGTGKSGGCGGGVSHPPGILEQAKSWKNLRPGESLTVSYKRTELFVFEQAPGVYDFWGEYQPPQLTADDIKALKQAGIDFPRKPLRSTHLRFNRPD
jgi:hypothetical protein